MVETHFVIIHGVEYAVNTSEEIRQVADSLYRLGLADTQVFVRRTNANKDEDDTALNVRVYAASLAEVMRPILESAIQGLDNGLLADEVLIRLISDLQCLQD